MWLFHFRVGGELQSGSRTHAHGIGHAMRCLSVMRVAQSRGIPTAIVANAAEQTDVLLSARGASYHPDSELERVLAGGVNVVVSDINYLEDDVFDLYRRTSPCACLAPRGRGKYLSDLSFRDVQFEDEPPPTGGPRGTIYAGTDYAVTHPAFQQSREQLDEGRLVKDPETVVVAMGGVDARDQTGVAVAGLQGLPASWCVRVVIGVLYPHRQRLDAALKKLACRVEIHSDPVDPVEWLAKSSYAVSAAGLTSYEAAGLGAPCFNLCLTKFHERRSRELADLELGFHLGYAEDIGTGRIAEEVLALDGDRERVDRLRASGRGLVDGRGAERIVETIQSHLTRTQNGRSKNK